MRMGSCVGRSFGVFSAQPVEVQSRKRRRAEAIITQLTVTNVGKEPGMSYHYLMFSIKKVCGVTGNFVIAVRYHHPKYETE